MTGGDGRLLDIDGQWKCGCVRMDGWTNERLAGDPADGRARQKGGLADGRLGRRAGEQTDGLGRRSGSADGRAGRRAGEQTDGLGRRTGWTDESTDRVTMTDEQGGPSLCSSVIVTRSVDPSNGVTNGRIGHTWTDGRRHIWPLEHHHLPGRRRRQPL